VEHQNIVAPGDIAKCSVEHDLLLFNQNYLR